MASQEGKRQALQPTIEQAEELANTIDQAVNDYLLANTRLAGLESRNNEWKEKMTTKLLSDFPALQTAAKQVATELVLVNGWLDSLGERMESIEELTKEQFPDDLPASQTGEHQAKKPRVFDEFEH